MTAPPPAKAKGVEPCIPEKYVDAPTQRLYALSLGLLLFAIKVLDWLQSIVSFDNPNGLVAKWLAVDGLYCICLKLLRIPRLNYSVAVVLLQIFGLWFSDGLLFGGIQIGLSHYSLTSGVRNIYQRELSTTGKMVNVKDIISGNNLRGEHTVLMSPVSTAKLNPDGNSYCLNSPSHSILVPILLNNTRPSHIRYSLQSLGTDKIEYVDFSSRDLRSFQQSYEEQLQLTKSSNAQNAEISEDDYDAEDALEQVVDDRQIAWGQSPFRLEKTQSISLLKVTKPGLVKIEHIADSSSSTDVRIYPGEVLVVPCPTAEFLGDPIAVGESEKCVGHSQKFTIKIEGVPPLSLQWFREVNGQREHFSVEGIEGEHEKAQKSQTIKVPLDVDFDTVGTHHYVLNTITDAVGNVVTLTKKPTDELRYNSRQTRWVRILRRPAVSFKGCAPSHPASLLMGGEVPLRIGTIHADEEDGPWDVTVDYQPPVSLNGTAAKKLKPWKKDLIIKKDRKDAVIQASSPGEYTILSVAGQVCSGDILNPQSCPVVEQPHPAADIEWKRIHECSGDTGISSFFILHGKAPFQVHYLQQRNSEPARERVHNFQGSRGELTLQPDSSGNYTFTFTHVSDANYKRVSLDGPSINLVVHPLATAHFTSHKPIINSCAGGTVDVDVDMKGKGPWNLQVQVVAQSSSQVIAFNDLKQNRETIHIPIPPTLDKAGGSFQIDLVSIADSYGCKKELAVPGVSVNVRRVKPTAKFYTQDGRRLTTVLEKDEAKLPLRLTGEGPWKIKYRRVQPTVGPPKSAVLHNANDLLKVREDGLYELMEVSDSMCPGTINEKEADFLVNWIPRPSVKFAETTPVTYEPSNGSFILPPICEGEDDHVDLELSGRPPFQIVYNVARNSETGGTRIIDQPVISSIQTHTRFQLHTSEAGRMYYEVKQLGDAAYPLQQNKDRVLPRMERILFEQEVQGRPAAYFKSSARLSFCLQDPFTPRDSFLSDGAITLEGKAPFFVELSVKSMASSEVYKHTVELHGHHWKVDLTHYVFKSIGPHFVKIESVRDATNCKQAVVDPMRQYIWVDVAETAAIVPFDRREHFCVGEVTHFQLEGSPPWTIGYKSNKKHHEQVAKQSPFSLVHQYPGDFSIVSISHQGQMCKTAVHNVNFEVHALPSATVAKGHQYWENIHEGNQAQVIFTLTGEPPFTFTYQRSEPPVRKGGKPGKVLETHTVSGITNNEYTIYSALEGTWTVTFISDKYCRYPPLQQEGTVD